MCDDGNDSTKPSDEIELETRLAIFFVNEPSNNSAESRRDVSILQIKV
jgi:hypothetical protein